LVIKVNNLFSALDRGKNIIIYKIRIKIFKSFFDS